MQTFAIFLPMLLFLALLVVAGNVRERVGSGGFLSHYFLGERSLKGFVLAMTLVATYGSVSSFVSGPGLAWKYGLGWVVFAAPQIITGFLVLGVLGKKLALVGRRINAVTLIDVIDARFRFAPLAYLLSALMLCFFTTMMVGQFIGGAQIISHAAGIDYAAGLVVFAIVVIFYTTVGGFRAVAITDTICAILMLVGMASLAMSLANEAGGFAALLEIIQKAEQSSALFSPTSLGALPITLLFSAWVLVGFATVALPQSAVRCMAYRSTRDLHLAMIVSTVVCGALMIGMTLLGFLARGVIVDVTSFGGNTDAMMPYLISHHMSPWAAGITLVGPLAATMSTVSSLLIAASSAIVKDLWLRQKPRLSCEAMSLTRYAKASTALLGLFALVLAINPFEIIVWINMFAFGGLEIAFLCPLVGGLFWKKATASGAVASVVAGLLTYLSISLGGLPIAGWHAVVPALFVCIVVFIVVSLLTKNKHDLEDFFPSPSAN